MKIRVNNRKVLNYIIIILFACVLSIPLLSKNFNLYNGKGLNDIAEAYEFEKNFETNDGKILTAFSQYIGTGNLLLKSPLATFLLFLGNYLFDSYILSYKFLSFFCLVFSSIFMHKLVDKVTSNKNIALLSSLIYIFAPFHLNQIYICNSIQNSLIFMFFPIMFLGLYKLFNTTENSFWVIIGICGIILTDFNMCIVAGISALLYVLLNIKNWPVEKSRNEMIISLIFIIGITAFFVWPYFEINMKTEYMGSNITKETFLENRLSITNLFVTNDSADQVYEFGPFVIIMFAFSLVALNRLNENKVEFSFALIMTFLNLWMSTKLFPWGIFPDSISKLEATSNFLIPAVFFESFICAMNMEVVLRDFEIRDVVIISSISIFYLLALNGFIPKTNEIYEIDKYNISEIKETRFLPKKAYDNIEYINSRSREVEVIKGTAEISDRNKYFTNYKFKSSTLEKETIYELPYLYYPGYELSYDGITLECFESDNGLVAFEMNPELGTHFELNYVGTKLMNYTKIISFVSVLIFSIYVYKKH